MIHQSVAEDEHVVFYSRRAISFLRRIDSLIMVADYYHISIDYLVYGEDRDYISSLSEGLTDSQKRIVRATTENLIKNIKRYQQR